MNRIVGKLGLILLCAAGVLGGTVVSVRAEGISAPKTLTFYDKEQNNSEIIITGVDADVKITDVKSSKTSVIELTKGTDGKVACGVAGGSAPADEYTYDYLDEEEEERIEPEVQGEDVYAYIYFVIKKPGTATVSYKLDGKSYKTKIVVEKWTNPLKTIKIPNVKYKGKSNLSGGFAKTNEQVYKLSKTVKKKEAAFTAADGWYIEKVSFFYGGATSKPSYYTQEAPKTKESGMYIPEMKAGKKYQFWLTCKNKKNGAIETCRVKINY